MIACCYLDWPSTELTADVWLPIHGISELDIHFLLQQTLTRHCQNNPLLLQRTHFKENKSQSCTWRANIPSLLFAVAVICCWEIVGDEESCDQDGVASKLPPPLPLLLWTLMKPLYRREEPAYTQPFAEIPNLRPSFDTCCRQTGP